MKKVLFITIAIAAAGIAFACMPKNAEEGNPENATATTVSQKETAESTIKWMSWDEAIKANEKNPKKIFIDFYTHWCGWCKRMDATTFSDPSVAQYVNKNFYPVKFNAEQKEDIVFQGTTFSYRPGGRRGVHMLAAELLNGRLGYPSYVYLTPTYERILISPGYKKVPDMQKELKFVAEEHYTTTSWEKYKAAGE